MGRQGIDALVLTGGTSLRYFTSIEWGLSERLLAVVLPRQGRPSWCPRPSSATGPRSNSRRARSATAPT